MRRLAAALAALVALAACAGSKPKTGASRGSNDSDYILPAYIPTGFHVARAQLVQQGPTRSTFAAAIGRPGGDGSFDDVIVVIASPATADGALSPQEHPTSVDVNGVTARVVDGQLTGAVVDWFAGGFAVSVIGPPGAGPAATDAARHVRLPASGDVGAVAMDGTPAGYQTIESAHFTGHAPERGAQVVLANKDNVSIGIGLSRTAAPLELALGIIEHLEPTTVRGHRALIGANTRSLGGSSVTAITLGWYDRPGQLITVSGPTTPDALRSVATGLNHATAADWRDVVAALTTTTRP